MVGEDLTKFEMLHKCFINLHFWTFVNILVALRLNISPSFVLALKQQSVLNHSAFGPWTHNPH